ncbi:MAG: nicotinate-nicotinamide nucleotide adenylyltransferase, partial [Desulfovibrionaceae bacterium]|nr:nicotinate-nicotinamide nucleotide adenylyltransferase [Desulfovibrionaceae bacterium]
MSSADRTAPSGIAILGGSFNPLHVGHLRLAVEIYEALGAHIARVDLVPSAHPPHKEESRVLPFALRARLAREAAAPYPWLRCSELEGERDLPSYTWDTLGLYAERERGRRIFFVLGIEDYAQLPAWRNGLRMP